MEYDVNNELNYTILHIRSILVLKKRNKQKATKMTPTQIPPGGMGNGLERAYSKKWFYLLLVTESAHGNYHKILGPYTGWNQDLTIMQKF